MTEREKEEYLGDGLYASFNGYAIVLREPRVGGDHFVAFEPSVYEALVRYANRVFLQRGQAA